MRLPRLVRRLLSHFSGGQLSTALQQPTEREDSRFMDDLPPGYTLIETQVRGQHIDGTGRWVGEDARVIQAPNNELITLERGRTIRCGCDHLASVLEEVITPSGVQRGVGGFCHDCDGEAQDLLRRGAISPAEAESRSMYCSRCGSHCDGCGRHNLCKRHTKLFKDADGQEQCLCPECLQKAARKKRFTQTVAAVARLLSEEDKPAQPNGQGDSYGY